MGKRKTPADGGHPIGMLPDGTMNVVKPGDPPFMPRIIPDPTIPKRKPKDSDAADDR